MLLDFFYTHIHTWTLVSMLRGSMCEVVCTWEITTVAGGCEVAVLHSTGLKIKGSKWTSPLIPALTRARLSVLASVAAAELVRWIQMRGKELMRTCYHSGSYATYAVHSVLHLHLRNDPISRFWLVGSWWMCKQMSGCWHSLFCYIVFICLGPLLETDSTSS